MEVDNIKAKEKNKALTATLLDISSKIQVLRDNVTRVPGARTELDQVIADTSIAKTRWTVMKSVVGAVIAGSGVDWARNETLRDLVLDNEDDMA